MWFWYVSLAAFSAVGFGVAAYHSRGGNELIGINVALGVFCFTLALVSGISRAIERSKDE
jgi:hypothetical protein